MNFKITISIYSFLLCVCWIRGEVLINTKLGQIRGIKATDGDYTMFLGIPFAQVNLENPFGAAKPYPPFDDVFEAFDDSAVCPQIESDNAVGTIDCLHLNVHVPSIASSNNRLPVLVWIYGGAFMRGNSRRYGPKFLVRHDVIIVLLNYRVGPYGFMCLDIPEVPGNQGLKDQLLALRWVKDNIEDFGGDVNKITVFGESAGGHSIDFHLISSEEKLYNNVILQSGSSLAATVFEEPDKIAPIRIARYIGFETNDIYEALAYISSVDKDTIIRAVTSMNNIYKPCVEKQFEGVNAFLTENWINAEVPKAKGLPILIGFNDDEMIMRHANQPLEHFENLDIFSSYLNKTFVFENDYLSKMEKIVKDFYVGDGELNPDMKRGVINYDSDYTYIHPKHRTIRKYVEAGAGGGIFFYMFSYSGNRNIIKNAMNITTGGAAHGEELGYLFDMPNLTEVPTADDQLIIDQMTTMWTNFAKFSNPTPVKSELLPVTWTPLTEDNYYYMNINTTLSVGSKPINKRMAFWDLFFKLNKKLQRLFK